MLNFPALKGKILFAKKVYKGIWITPDIQDTWGLYPYWGVNSLLVCIFYKKRHVHGYMQTCDQNVMCGWALGLFWGRGVGAKNCKMSEKLFF